MEKVVEFFKKKTCLKILVAVFIFSLVNLLIYLLLVKIGGNKEKKSLEFKVEKKAEEKKAEVEYISDDYESDNNDFGNSNFDEGYPDIETEEEKEDFLKGDIPIITIPEICKSFTSECSTSIKSQMQKEQDEFLGKKEFLEHPCGPLFYDPKSPEYSKFFKPKPVGFSYLEPEEKPGENYYRSGDQSPFYLDPIENRLYLSDYEKKHKTCKEMNVQKITFKNDHRSKYTDFEFVDGMKIDTDYCRGFCTQADKVGVTYHAQIVKKAPKVKLTAAEKKEKFNFLFVGLDSLSTGCYEKWLPNMQKFLRDVERKKKCRVFRYKRMNTVGDGTTDNILAFVGPKLEDELPTSVRENPGAIFIDKWPWIFNDLKEKGYITSYNDQNPGLGTFQYRLKGWNEPPTEHYFRIARMNPAYPEGKKWKTTAFKNEMWLTEYPISNGVDQYFRTYDDPTKTIEERNPLYSFVFTDSLHNDNTQAGGHDKFYADIFRKYYNFRDIRNVSENFRGKDFKRTYVSLQRDDVFNGDLGENTITFFFGDHGVRYFPFRNDHLMGRLEERNPLLIMILPRRFNKKPWSKFLENARENQDVLVTGFDAQATVRHLIDHLGEKGGYLPKNEDYNSNGKKRLNSLLLPINKHRTCKDIGIKPKFCTCAEQYRVKEEDLNHPFYILAATEILENVNKNLEENCSASVSPLLLSKIVKVRLESIKTGHMLSFIKHERYEWEKNGFFRKVYLINFWVTNKDKTEIKEIEGAFFIHHKKVKNKDWRSVNWKTIGDITLKVANIIKRISKKKVKNTCSLYNKNFCKCVS